MSRHVAVMRDVFVSRLQRLKSTTLDLTHGSMVVMVWSGDQAAGFSSLVQK